MNKTRELIESDQKYKRFKNVVLHIMSNDGATEWYTDEQWREAMPFLSRNEYNHVAYDMLDDSEIKREYNRDVTPNKTRWVMKERKENEP